MGGCPIDLVGEDDVGEDRSLDEADDAFPRRAIFLDDFRAKDVRRHQVRRELNPVELQIDRFGELLDEECLGQARHAAQEAVSAGEKRNQNFAYDALLSDDGLRELTFEPAGDLGDALERNGG